MRVKKQLKKRYRIVKKKPLLENNILAALLVLFSATIFFYYFFLFYAKFQLSDVNIISDRDIDHESVSNFVFSYSTKKYFPKETRSMFLVNKNDLQKELVKRMPVIKDVNVVKKFPSTLSLAVQERVPVAIWCYEKDDNDCLFIDENGIAFQKSHYFSDSFFIILSISESPPVLGEVVIFPEEIQKMLSVKSNLEKKGFIVRYFNIERGDKVGVFIDDGWRILISFEDVNYQIENFFTVYDTIKNQRKALKYIDLRFGDRIYYK